MEKKDIIVKLKAKYSNLGLSDKTFDGVAAMFSQTEDDKIDEAINGVETLLKSVQGEVDSRVNKALDEKKAKETKSTNAGTGAAATTTEPPNTETSEGKNEPQNIAALLKEALAPITQELTALKTAKATENNSAKVLAALKGKVDNEAFIIGR